MTIDRGRLYTSPDEFFDLGGSVVMKLSTDAAVAICHAAASRGLVVARIEGGLWHNPGFEARLDCIWDGVDPPVSIEIAEENNRDAADFIRTESGVHDVFIITAPPFSG